MGSKLYRRVFVMAVHPSMNQYHRTMEIHELATAFSACMCINTQYSDRQFQQKFGNIFLFFPGNFMQIVSAQQNNLHEMSNPISEKVRKNFCHLLNLTGEW